MSDSSSPATPSGGPRRKRPLVPAVVAVVALVAAAAVGIASLRGSSDGHQQSGGGPAATVQTSQKYPDAPPESGKAPDSVWKQLVRRKADDPTALGKADAPVVMLAYSEFQCPYCGKFARDTEPTLIKKYVDTGVLRIEWRDFPYLGKESTLAAHAARAAADQDRFWQYHDALYAHQKPVNSGGLDTDYLVGLAGRLGMDETKFRTDMRSVATKGAVNEDFAQGQSIGITGTPAFVIDAVPVIGAQPLKVFEQTIERAASQHREPSNDEKKGAAEDG